MSIDKRITHRRNFKGGADMGTVSTSTRAATNKGAPNVSAGGASFNNLGPEPSGQRYKESRQEFVDNLNRNNASRFEPSFSRRTYKPVTLDTVGAKNQLRNKGGIRNLFKALLGFAVPGANFLFNKGSQGITNINNALGDFREKFTGYRTQEEYDNARQQRINLGRINTIQNTLDRKYADGDYSMTDLDERLANLKSQMGIVPNTPEQNAQQFLNFGNELAENTQQTIFPAPTIEPNAQGYLYPTEGIAGVQFPEQTSGVQFPEQTSKAEIESALGPGFRPSRDKPFEQVFPQRQLYPFADY
jgi:hypothetical protein|tara:strand:+ start:178 stop:1083 length:906 start_codon:yes stop_codon:yes gene_type:complete